MSGREERVSGAMGWEVGGEVDEEAAAGVGERSGMVSVELGGERADSCGNSSARPSRSDVLSGSLAVD